MTCEFDQHYMRLVLDLARKSDGQTSPNPFVGAVIVKSREVLAKGYHKKAGLPHAEIIALHRAGFFHGDNKAPNSRRDRLL